MSYSLSLEATSSRLCYCTSTIFITSIKCTIITCSSFWLTSLTISYCRWLISCYTLSMFYSSSPWKITSCICLSFTTICIFKTTYWYSITNILIRYSPFFLTCTILRYIISHSWRCRSVFWCCPKTPRLICFYRCAFIHIRITWFYIIKTKLIFIVIPNIN